MKSPTPGTPTVTFAAEYAAAFVRSIASFTLQPLSSSPEPERPKLYTSAPKDTPKSSENLSLLLAPSPAVIESPKKSILGLRVFSFLNSI